MWVDPKNDITTIFMIQTNEAPADYPVKMRQWVYGGYKDPAAAAAPAAPAGAAPAGAAPAAPH